ncbi:MAG: helix-turn-helix domain-containing protein [Oscillospiraceae bacterium]|nr:helix-turn-helix domain-containing protein [Oscillospiraceae bacterium]
MKNSKKFRIYSWDEVPLFVDLSFCSALLGICKETLRQKCAEGKIKAIKSDAGWRVAKATLLDYYNNGGVI